MLHSISAIPTRRAVQERGRMLYRLADLVEENAEELALLETLVSNLKPSVNANCVAKTVCISQPVFV